MKKMWLGWMTAVLLLMCLAVSTTTATAAGQNTDKATIAMTTGASDSMTFTANTDQITTTIQQTLSANTNNGAATVNDKAIANSGQTGTKDAADRTTQMTTAIDTNLLTSAADNTGDFRANITTTAMTAQQTAASTTWKDGAHTVRVMDATAVDNIDDVATGDTRLNVNTAASFSSMTAIC